MTRKVLILTSLLLGFGSLASAGEIKFHRWPATFLPQEVVTVPVVMDIGYYVAIEDQDNLQIKLQQTSINTYRGCTDVRVRTNFDMALSCDIQPTGAVSGDFSCSVTPADLAVPGGEVEVCARLEDADLVNVPGGSRNVQVAVVTIKVVPR